MRKIQDKVVGSFRKVLGKVAYGETPEICLQHTALSTRYAGAFFAAFVVQHVRPMSKFIQLHPIFTAG